MLIDEGRLIGRLGMLGWLGCLIACLFARLVVNTCLLFVVSSLLAVGLFVGWLVAGPTIGPSVELLVG